MATSPPNPMEIRKQQSSTTLPVASTNPTQTPQSSGNTSSPIVPSRPQSLPTNRPWDSRYSSSYSSPYASPYNSYSSPYSSYSSPYNSYSRYSNNYGNSGYYPRYGNVDPRYGAPGLIDSGYRSVGQAVEGFSRFSRLLDANFDALHGSFASIVRLMEVAGEFFHALRTFAVVQLFNGGIAKIGRLFRWLLFGAVGANYLHSQQTEQRRRMLLPMIWIILGVTLVSAPILLVKFFRMLKRQHEQLQLENTWEQPVDPNQPHMVQAVAQFQGSNEAELSFNKDDNFMVISKPYQDWWEGEFNGHKGLFPANFVQPIK